jgi:glycosyltransferase involved in cell wall biosynthesis
MIAFKFTVTLCTHNHADRLRRTLTDLSQVVSPDSTWELLVVDNASSDRTPVLLREPWWNRPDVPLRIVREENLGLSNARNRAIDEARGEYIVFMDDDETADPGWLQAFDRATGRIAPDAFGGRIEVLFEEGKRPRWLDDDILPFLGKLDLGMIEGRITNPGTPIFGGNFGFRRSLFREIGNFDSGLGRRGKQNIGGEDTQMFRRLMAQGRVVYWVPEAVIHHRIQTWKLKRSYFLDLHFQQGRIEGSRNRQQRSRVPPPYLFGHLARAVKAALAQRLSAGGDKALRKEMNVAYFLGYIRGWTQISDAP